MIDMFTYMLDRWTGRAPKGAKRSKEWRKVRKKHIQENGACAVCCRKTKLEVHHIVPFHLAPQLELEPNNLVTLCRSKKNGINCHLLVGHLGNFRSANPDCSSDAWDWHRKIKRGRDIIKRLSESRERVVK